MSTATAALAEPSSSLSASPIKGGKERRNRNNYPTNRGPMVVEKLMTILKAKGVLFIVPDTRNINHVAIGVADALFRSGLIRASDVTDLDLYLRKKLVSAPSAQITEALASKAQHDAEAEKQRLALHG